MGGEKEHKLSVSELPVVSGTITPHWSEDGTPISAVSGVFSATGSNSAYRDGGTKTSGTSSVKAIKLSFGKGESHNTLPPYLAQISWCGLCKARTLMVLIFSAGLQVAASSIS